MFWSAPAEEYEIRELTTAAAALGVTILSERIADPAKLPARLRGLTGRADAFWLFPDPGLVTPETFAILREYSYAQKTPFFAPTEGLAEKGATASLSASYFDVGRAAARALRARLSGNDVTVLVHPNTLTVTVNLSAARSVGLALTPEALKKIDRSIP